MYHFVLLGHAKEEMCSYAKGESTLGFHSYKKSFSMLQRFYILSQALWVNLHLHIQMHINTHTFITYMDE